MSEDIKVCVFAGDPEDTGCVSCDGKTFLEGTNIPVDKCAGYQSKEDINLVNETAPISQDSTTHVQNTTDYIPKGITTCIRVESGISKEIRGEWYKFNYCEERTVPEDCDLQQEIIALWNHANSVVDTQINCVK